MGRQFYTYLRAVNSTATVTENDILGAALAVERSELHKAACGIEMDNWSLQLLRTVGFSSQCIAPPPHNLPEAQNSFVCYVTVCFSPRNWEAPRNTRPHEEWLQQKAGGWGGGEPGGPLLRHLRSLEVA